MNSLENAEKILETLGEVSESAEVNWQSRERSSLATGAGSPVMGSGTATSFSIRISRNGKLGTSGCEGDPHPAALAEGAIGSSRSGPDFNWELPRESPATQHFKTPEKLPGTGDVLDFSRRLSDGVRKLLPGALLASKVEWGTDTVGIMNSEGCRGEYRRSRVKVDATVSSATEEGLYRRSSSFACAFLPSPLDALEWLFPGLEYAGLGTDTVVGRKTVVFAPPALGVLLQAIRTGVSGRVLLDGASRLAGKQGETVVSKLLTIREMPLLESGASSAPFDSEGVPTCNKALFRKGVFRQFLFDLASGAEAGLPSTGNAGKNLGGQTVPVCTNLKVEPGDGGTLGDMIGRVKDGVLVSGILSAEGSDAAGGGMLLDCGTAWSISDGEVSGRLTGCLITGSAYGILERVVEVGRVLQVTGTDTLPPVTARGVRIR